MSISPIGASTSASVPPLASSAPESSEIPGAPDHDGDADDTAVAAAPQAAQQSAGAGAGRGAGESTSIVDLKA